MSFIPLADAAPLIEPVAPGWQLVTAALLAIALIVVLITVGKMHPFLALIFGGLTVGIVAGENINDVLASFTTGFGTTAAGVGALIALGAMFAKLLADSGGADQIVDTIVGKSSRAGLPWAMAGVGALIGLPMFFEIGLVLLMPVIYLVARRAQLSVITIGIPTLAGLSAMHGLVPPHPGPLLAIQTLNADLGLTLMFGVIVAIPTVIIGGPLFGRLAGRWVDVPAPDLFGEMEETEKRNRPSFGITLATVLLPVVLMMAKAIVDIVVDNPDDLVQQVFDVIGNPFVALLTAVVVAMFTFGQGSGMDREGISASISESLPPIAGILLIVSAGGGFKQVLVDTGIGTLLADWAKGAERLGDPAGLGDRRPDPPGHRLGHRRHHHRVGADGGAGPGHRPGRDLAGGARDRLRLAVLLPRQRRRLLAGQGVLRAVHGPDDQVLVADGDGALGQRAGVRAAARDRRLARPVSQVKNPNCLFTQVAT